MSLTARSLDDVANGGGGITATGFDVNNDIGVEVVGAAEHPLARASSSYTKATVTVVAADGRCRLRYGTGWTRGGRSTPPPTPVACTWACVV